MIKAKRFSMIYNDTEKNKAWDSLIISSSKPPMLTEKRLQKLKIQVWNDDDFWSDLLLRHSLRNYALNELDSFTREHAIGNFWGMLCQCYIKNKQK